MDQLKIQEAVSRLREYRAYTSNVNELVEQYLESARSNHSKSTMPSKTSRLRRFAAFCNAAVGGSIHDVDAIVVKVFLDDYERTHKSSSTNALRKDVTVFLEWVRGFKEIDVRVHGSTVERYKEKKLLPKALDYETVRYVIKNIDNEQDRIMIALTVEAGLRIGELESLMVQDISGWKIHIRGKGERDRIVLITATLAEELHLFVTQHDRRDVLFKNLYNGYGEAMTKGTMRKRMQGWFMKLAGLSMTPHQLRHTFAIMLLTQGCDIVTIKKLMGHKYIETTMVYLQIVDDFMISQYKKHALTSVIA